MFIFEDVIAMPDGCDAHVNDGHIGHLGSQLLDHPCKAKKFKTPLVKKNLNCHWLRKAQIAPA